MRWLRNRQDANLFGACMLASLSLLTVLVWWGAFLSPLQWQVLLVLNRFGEQWVEGIMFHGLLLFAVWLVIKVRAAP